MQRDVAFQGRAESQTAGDAEFVANPPPAVQESALVHRTEGHPKLTPIILKIVDRGWHPEIGEAEVFPGCGVPCGPMGELLNGAVLRTYSLINTGMIDHALMEFCWRPGKDEYVVPRSGLDLSEGVAANLLHGNQIDRDVGIVLLAPVRSPHFHEPVIEFGKEVCPFSDFQRFRAGQRVGRKQKEWTEGGSASCEPEEITSRKLASSNPGHSASTCESTALSCKSLEKAPWPGFTARGNGFRLKCQKLLFYCPGADSKQNFPVCCRHLKLLITNGSSKLLCVVTSRNASEVMPPLRGSGIAGQTSQAAPPSVPPGSSCPSAPQGPVPSVAAVPSSQLLSSLAVKTTGKPSGEKPFP